MLGGIGPTELLLILAIVLILFGAGRLPQVFEQMGRGVRAFRDAQKEESIDVTTARPADPAKELAEHPEAQEVKEKSKVG